MNLVGTDVTLTIEGFVSHWGSFAMNKPNESKIKKLKEAKAEAERFIAKCDKAIKHLSTPEYTYDKREYYPDSSKKFAAAKRASLDLSESLVELRKS